MGGRSKVARMELRRRHAIELKYEVSVRRTGWEGRGEGRDFYILHLELRRADDKGRGKR